MSAATLEAEVEAAAVELFADLGWDTVNVYDEVHGEQGTLGRATRADVVLVPRLRAALAKLNPGVADHVIDLAIDEIARDRSALGIAQANREVYGLLKNGVKLRVAGAADARNEADLTIKVVDWDHPAHNDYLCAQQVWIQGDVYLRRADLVGFVNGLPLVFVELKGIHKNVEVAYRDNIRDYLTAIPQAFWFNAFIVVSNGFESRVGSLTAGWEHYKDWKRIEREDEPPRVSLEVVLRAVCDKARLCDLVENFTLFSEVKSGVAKIVGQNHQFLGVNNALAAVRRYHLASGPRGTDLAERRRLGVFWHTQGSGKSFSMVFFSQKILRKLRGDWTFLVLTDRDDLDDQIYKTFVSCGVVPPKPRGRGKGVQATTSEHLRQLLGENHRYVFTLIQKFRTDVRGARYPKISDRSDIIVIADEAHRSQYDTFAMNLRSALPNAAFIGFTGTPLMAGEEKTREVFGDYVSVYNFRQAIEDGATVPLYYEARVPELQLTNDDFADDLAAVIEEADLDEDQQKKLEREFARQYHLITRDERLDRIADDLVDHFLGLNTAVGDEKKPFATKAMVIAIDKLTAVRMHDKVRRAWQRRLDVERAKAAKYLDAEARTAHALVRFMAETDMAVVVSQGQNEVATFKEKVLDIAPHRARMEGEDLDTKFKDENDPLRIVFVCAMWMTGFDVPSCGAVYLDKPMRNHTLMQTIARANRVFQGKVNGLIVDYVGVFRNLQKALAIYGTSSGGGVKPGDSPVQPREVQLEELARHLADARAFCAERGIDVAAIATSTKLARLGLLRQGIEKLVHPVETKKRFLEMADAADRVYRALSVDKAKEAHAPAWGVVTDLARGLRGLEKPVDITEVMSAIERLLDESVGAEAYREPGARGGQRFHLGRIDFDALARFFKKTPQKASTVASLTAAAGRRVHAAVTANPTRGNLRGELERMIAEYNEGKQSPAKFFEDLVAFLKKLEAEEQRGSAEGLDPERLAFFDLLRAATPDLSAKELATVKAVAKELPARLAKKLVLDWRKSQRGRAGVRAAIEDALDALPEAYGPEAFRAAVAAVYEHVFESYWGDGKGKYAAPESIDSATPR